MSTIDDTRPPALVREELILSSRETLRLIQLYGVCLGWARGLVAAI